MKKDNLNRKVLKISYFSAAYNLLEGIASVLTGAAANSIALLGFGLDSFVESLSGFVIIWQFSQHKGISKKKKEKIEKTALRLIAYSFFLMAAYVFYESAEKLYLREMPEPSFFGMIIALVSMIVAPILFFLKYKTGKLITSHSLVADSKQQIHACCFPLLYLSGWD